MFGIGMPELMVIMVVALIVLGPKRLPEVARALGKGLAEFRRATSEVNEELQKAQRAIEAEARAHEAERREAERKAAALAAQNAAAAQAATAESAAAQTAAAQTAATEAPPTIAPAPAGERVASTTGTAAPARKPDDTPS